MDRRERINDLETTFLVALQGWQKDLWTALPGIIQSFDPSKKTCSVQVSIQAKQTDPETGKSSWVSLPILVDCPVFFPSGGGYTLTFPLVKGDECLVVFASRCIDAWWQSGKVDIQATLRMHDLSDGFVFAGVSSTPNVQPNISVNSTQLRTNAGATFIEIKGNDVNINATNITVNSTNANVNASGVATITSPSIILKNAGTALKKLINENFIAFFNSHVHSNGNGGANTGAPTSGSSPSAHATSITKAE